MLYYSVEDSHKAERHLLVAVKQYDREFQNLEINTLESTAHHPPPTHTPPPPPTNLMATV